MKANKEIIMNAISNLGFEVFRNGQFHWNSSNTPDMYINQDGSIHCWTSSPFKSDTSNHGDLIDFVQMVNKSSFVEAKKEAERLTGLTLPSLDTYKDNGYTIDNTNRKTGFIDEEFIKNFEVGRYENFERFKVLLNEALPSLDFEKQKELALKYQIGYIEMSDRLSMPIKDEENRIVTLWKYNKNPSSYKNEAGNEITPSKVLFTKGRDRCPFNLYDMQEFKKDVSQEVFLCAGEKDTLNMIGNGFNAVTLGAENENLKDKYKSFFQDLKIVIAYDNDDAGQKGAEKILKQLQGVAKEIKVWNWNKVQKNQDLTLFKGFDMTDYLSAIKKQNLEFDKTNYQEDIKSEEPVMKDKISKKELLQKTTQNKIRLAVVEKQMQSYKEFINSKRKEKENELDFKINPKIFKDIYDKDLSIDEKIDLTTTKVDELKEESKNIGEKIKDYSESKMVDKSELFRTLEKEIHQFSAIVEALKNENRELRRELELLIQKDEKEKEQKSLEKENKNLQEKIENMKNKKTTSKEQTPEKINKISYEKTYEQEM